MAEWYEGDALCPTYVRRNCACWRMRPRPYDVHVCWAAAAGGGASRATGRYDQGIFPAGALERPAGQAHVLKRLICSVDRAQIVSRYECIPHGRGLIRARSSHVDQAY